jgi:hypothetical protein
MPTSPLTPEQRTVYWTVAVHETYGSVHRSTGLHSASAVRHQYGFWAPRPSTARIELTEHTLIQTGSVTSFEDLPGEGEATPLPDLPVGAHEVKRFFKFTRAHEDGSLTGFGPAVLPTGDDVRYFYNWTISTQDTALAERVEVSTLRILDITLTHYTREISRALLPDAVSAALLARLDAEGLEAKPAETSAGSYLVIPLADDSEIIASGTSSAGDDVSILHTAEHHGSWIAEWHGPDGSCVIYNSDRQRLPHAEDTAALAASVIEYAREHGGGPIRRDSPQQPHSDELAQDS